MLRLLIQMLAGQIIQYTIDGNVRLTKRCVSYEITQHIAHPSSCGGCVNSSCLFNERCRALPVAPRTFTVPFAFKADFLGCILLTTTTFVCPLFSSLLDSSSSSSYTDMACPAPRLGNRSNALGAAMSSSELVGTYSIVVSSGFLKRFTFLFCFVADERPS